MIYRRIQSKLSLKLMDANSRTTNWFDRIEQLELPVCQYFNRASNYNLIRLFFKLISRLGDGVFWYSLIAATVFIYGKQALPAAMHILFTAALGVLIYKIIKERLVRERPFISHAVISCDTKALDRYSFPSGHTLHAVSFSIMLVSYYPMLIWLVAPFAVLVAMSRFILGLHYISDVVVGGAIGAIIAMLSLHMHPYLFQ